MPCFFIPKITSAFYCTSIFVMGLFLLLTFGCSGQEVDSINKETQILLDNVEVYYFNFGPDINDRLGTDRLCKISRNDDCFDTASELVKLARISCKHKEIEPVGDAPIYTLRAMGSIDNNQNNYYSTLFFVGKLGAGSVYTKEFTFRRIPDDMVQKMFKLWRAIEESKEGEFVSSFPELQMIEGEWKAIIE